MRSIHAEAALVVPHVYRYGVVRSAWVVPGWGLQDQGAVGLKGDLGAERLADPLKYWPQPVAVLGGGVAQPHLCGLHRHHVQGREGAGAGRYRGEVQQAQIAAEVLVAADALVVVDGIAAAIQDQSAPVDLDGAGVVGGVAVDEIGPSVDELVRETNLVIRHAIPPVAAPVHRHDNDVTRLPDGLHPGNEVPGGSAGQARQEIDARPRGGRGPVGPKSSTWLLASAHASGRAAVTAGRLPGLIR